MKSGPDLIKKIRSRSAVNNGDKEDNMAEIFTPVLVIQCSHCPGAKVEWKENSPGKPPDLIFRGFPSGGRMVMSQKTILLACDRCRGQLDVIQEEYGKTLVI